MAPRHSKPDDASHSRRTYLVDGRFQGRITLQLLSVLAGMGLLYVLAVLLIPGPGALEALDAAETRSLLLKANLIYFALAASILSVLSLLLTHRIAGPVRVMERAVRGMRSRDYSHRLSLRRHDYLKSLAAEIALLRAEIVAERAAVGDLARCLAENDVDGAREILDGLGATQSVAPAASTPVA